MGVEKIEPTNYKNSLQHIRRITCAVLVFHPQCGHCVEMRPKWEEMKKKVNPNVKIIEINGEGMHNSPELSNSPVGRNTEGFPSLLRLHKGKVVERFEGERSPEKMAEFVNRAIDKKKTIKPKRKTSLTKKLKKKKTRR